MAIAIPNKKERIVYKSIPAVTAPFPQAKVAEGAQAAVLTVTRIGRRAGLRIDQAKRKKNP